MVDVAANDIDSALYKYREGLPIEQEYEDEVISIFKCDEEGDEDYGGCD